jgi:hypothetical protein
METSQYHEAIIKNGLTDVVIAMIREIQGTNLKGMFDTFKEIHGLLIEYEKLAKRKARYDVKAGCLYRFREYKESITDNRQFLTAGVIKKTIEDNQTAIIKANTYDLCTVIEEIYLTIDFILQQISRYVFDFKNGIDRLFTISGYKGDWVLLKNRKGLTFVLNRKSGEAFIGSFYGESILRDNTQTVCDGLCWRFEKRSYDRKTVYEMV